jgi:hypothetical protein
MKKLIIPILTILSLLFHRCYYDNEEALYGKPGVVCDTTAVKFSTDILPIFRANCFVCHSAALVTEGGGGGYNLQDYNVVQSLALNGRLLGAVNHDPGYSPMPKYGNKLSDCNILLIKVWVNNGALNN